MRLFSAHLQREYFAIGSDNGEFVLYDVIPASDYRLSVSPRGMFRRYETHLVIENVQIDIDIVLSILPVGRLSGTLVGTDGGPVRDFRFLVKSMPKAGWSRHTTSDHSGHFEVEGVPQGSIEISSTYKTLIKITGHQFEPGQLSPAEFVIDAGPWSINGQVFDQHGEPIAGAVVLLNWTRIQGQLRSLSNRRTTTKPEGEFLFVGVGEGVHDMILSYADRSARRRVNIDQESIRIEQTPDLTG